MQVIAFLASGRMFRNGFGRDGFVGEVGTKLQSTVLVVCNEKTYNKRMNDQGTEGTEGKITRVELRAMARERGMKGYWDLRKLELAERLGIKLSKKRLRKDQGRPREALRVEVVSYDGTTTTYPSISKAAQALGVYPMQIYVIIARGDARFLD